MAYMINIIKGCFIGIGKILPGVSGAMIAMSFGIYDQAIHALRHYQKDILKNTLFLGSLALGIIFAMVCCSHVVSFCLEHYYLTTMLLFIGLILGGIPSIYHKMEKDIVHVSYLLIFFISFLFVFCLSKFQITDIQLQIESPTMMFLYMLLIGLIDAFTMVIPGISGTAVFMILGLYPMYLSFIQNIGNFSYIIQSMGTFFPYGVGLLFGIVVMVWIMDYLLNKHYKITYCGILGFSTSSLLYLFLETLSRNYTITDIVAGLMCLVVGYIFGHKFDG